MKDNHIIGISLVLLLIVFYEIFTLFDLQERVRVRLRSSRQVQRVSRGRKREEMMDTFNKLSDDDKDILRNEFDEDTW